MDRFGKIFGKKPDSSKPGRDTDRPVESQAENLQNKDLKHDSMNRVPASIPPEQKQSSAFGLKFILESGEERTFSSLPISIGRNNQNDLVLGQDTVSATHAVVHFDDLMQDICILDQDSLNGLYIDQLPTRKNILSDGMKIGLGDAVITFRDTGYIHSR